jgi:hypothetical protein
MGFPVVLFYGFLDVIPHFLLPFSSYDHLHEVSEYLVHRLSTLVSSHTLGNTGNIYNVSQIINLYSLSFALVTVPAHTLLYHSKQIRTQSRRSLMKQPDIRALLMSVYNGEPDWWYYLSSMRASITKPQLVRILTSFLVIKSAFGVIVIKV